MRCTTSTSKSKSTTGSIDTNRNSYCTLCLLMLCPLSLFVTVVRSRQYSHTEASSIRVVPVKQGCCLNIPLNLDDRVQPPDCLFWPACPLTASLQIAIPFSVIF